jgi:hypothetical protein
MCVNRLLWRERLLPNTGPRESVRRERNEAPQDQVMGGLRPGAASALAKWASNDTG